ncbi:DsbA family protein [Litoribrevibacter euphylliae]|uniref:DsbA family protein n=1 Tax=Litoribrevibacter euphylliae TaxID=1834034 RepID=A0ABV7HI55_9GAMM
MDIKVDKLLQSYLAAFICSKRLRLLRHSFSEACRKISRKGHHASFYFDLEDPYSYLLLPVIEELEQAFKISFDVHVVAPRDPMYIPDSDALERYALVDAGYQAQAWGLEFPTLIPSQKRLKTDALRILLQPRTTTAEWLQLAKQTMDAYWHGDFPTIHKLLQHNKTLDAFDVAAKLRENTEAFYKSGFYMAASIHYRGEWYWGLDRIYLLRDRLKRFAAQEHQTRLYPDWGRVRVPSRPQDKVDFYFSFRSPYSYIAIARLFKNQTDYPLEHINLKPVLPMVTRGLPVPKAKKMYILQDAARIAHFEDIDFGRVWDPLGKGVAQALAIFHNTPVNQQLAVSYRLMHDIWSQGQDVSSDAYLKLIASEFKLPIDKIHHSKASKSYEHDAETNRKALGRLGLWGVPSFSKGKLVAWGQDRMPLIFEKAF